jgi:hypothetical protein
MASLADRNNTLGFMLSLMSSHTHRPMAHPIKLSNTRHLATRKTDVPETDMYDAIRDMEPYDGQKSLREYIRSSHCIRVSREIYHGSPSTSAIMASSLADVGEDLHSQVL